MAKSKSKSQPKNTKRRISIDDLKKFTLVSGPQISPDGKRILFTQQNAGPKNQNLTNLHLVETATGETHRFTSAGKDRHGRWSPDGKSVAFISGRDEHSQIALISFAHGGEASVLTKFPEGSIRAFSWSPDGTKLAVAYRETDPEWTAAAKKQREESGASTPAYVVDDLYYRFDGDGYFNNQRFALYVVDVDSGEHRLIYNKDNTGGFTFDWSPDSSELVVSANVDKMAIANGWKDNLYRVNVATKKATKIPNLPVGPKSSVRWSPDGQWIAFAGRAGQEIWGSRNYHLMICRPDGSEFRNLTQHTDYCLLAITLSDTVEAAFAATMQWTRNSKNIVFLAGWQGSQRIAQCSLKENQAVSLLTSAGVSLGMGNFSSNGKRIAIQSASQTTLAEIGVGEYSSAGLKTTLLTKTNGELLAGLEVAKAKSFRTKSPDGTAVHGWIMTPPGFQKNKKYPAILQVHGGPHTQYGESFFHEFQVLAAAGYVVVYSNPRGSKGYGEDFCNCIRGDWGNKDWQDVQTVTNHMQSLPFIDNKRIGIMGGSYGGYMTNWAIGHSDEYKAAITDRCVSNLVSMAGSSDIPLVPGHYWDGNNWDDIEELWNQSPMKYMGEVSTPTLVIHSEGDLRCNVEQGEQVYATLRLLGVPTRFVRYPKETSHGLSRCGPTDLRMHRLEQIVNWWKEWL